MGAGKIGTNSIAGSELPAGTMNRNVTYFWWGETSVPSRPIVDLFSHDWKVSKPDLAVRRLEFLHFAS